MKKVPEPIKAKEYHIWGSVSSKIKLLSLIVDFH